MRRCIGFDYGRIRDHSAIAVMECEDEESGKYTIKHLDQHPLGSDYAPILDWVEEVARRYPHTPIVMDVGESGASLREQLRKRGLDVIGVRTTAGERESRDKLGVFHVATAVLAGLIDVATAEERLKLVPPGQRWATEFRRQLQGYERKRTQANNAKFGSRTESIHDDLVVAVQLCLWFIKHHPGMPAF